jgi:hypothetical protein
VDKKSSVIAEQSQAERLRILVKNVPEIKVGILRLSEEMDWIENPISYFRDFELDREGYLSRGELNELLLTTKIDQFFNKKFRRGFVEDLLEYFGK